MIEIEGTGLSEQQIIARAILHTYDIRRDDADFVKIPDFSNNCVAIIPPAESFRHLQLKTKNVDAVTVDKLKLLGFKAP